MQDNSYIVIQSWMITELKLSGNSLLVYAIIYGFSQDGESKFTGSLQYLADWCNATKQGIQKNLKELVEKGYITKNDVIKNGITYCEYGIQQSCIVYNKVAWGIQQSCINNIDNNIDINNTKVLFSNNNIETCSTTHSAKKKNLYDKCLAIIDEYTNNVTLKSSLINYLAMLLEVSKENNRPVYSNVFKGKLNELSRLSSDVNAQIKIVNQSISRGWINFYQLKEENSRYKDPMNESGVVKSVRAISEKGELVF